MLMKLVTIVTICSVLKLTTTSNVTNQQIEELEKQKNELYQQINRAIDDSVNTLKLANDSESLYALQQMSQLKDQIKELNETGSNNVKVDEIQDGTLSEAEHKKKDNSSDVRRRGTLMSDRNSRIRLELAELATILKKRGDKLLLPENSDEMKHRQLMQRKVELWIEQRKKEKEKIAAYKNKIEITWKLEKCPRKGTQKNKKDKFRRKSHKEKSRKYYPCCRKCCKYSYLGCL